MFSKILVAIDGSDNSFRALDNAIFLAKSIGSSLTAIHVIENPPTVYVESQKLLNDLLTNYRAESTKILDKCNQIAIKSEIRLETVIAEGDTAFNITKYAHKEKFDLIIVGSRGVGRFKEIVLGSVSNKVLHYAKCSVLIIK
jgi:nucleotide-binding universal stress UspA family protein